MAMAHAPLTQQAPPASAPSAAAAAVEPRKADAQMHSKRQFVPIRPAFRPLLPKPCNREPSPPNGIHIHTRATLSVGRKRLCATKADAQKRRKPTASQLPHISKVESKIDDLGASDEVCRSLTATPTASLSLSNAFNSIDTVVPGSEFNKESPPSSDSSSSSSPINSSAPESILSRKMGSKNSVSSLSGITTSTASIDGFGAPATPLSESSAVSTASIFGLSSLEPAATPSGTIDPMSMVIEGDEFDISGSGNSLSTLPPLEQTDVAVLTPPESQKSIGLSAFTAYRGGGEFDELSDFYFNNETSATETVDVSQQMNAADGSVSDKEEDFSILEYLAPTGDLF